MDAITRWKNVKQNLLESLNTVNTAVYAVSKKIEEECNQKCEVEFWITSEGITPELPSYEIPYITINTQMQVQCTLYGKSRQSLETAKKHWYGKLVDFERLEAELKRIAMPEISGAVFASWEQSQNQ